MRINNSGNVGIGTSPSGKFHVLSNSDVRIAGTGNSHYTYFYSNTTTAKGSIASLSSGLRVQAQSSGDLELFNTSNSGIIVKNSGNVGIGTSSPDFKAEIVGGTNDGLHIKDAESATVFGGLFTQSANLALITRSNHALTFGTNDAERMRIDSSGNVGISTSSPVELLDLGSQAQRNIRVGIRTYLGVGRSTGGTVLGHSVKADTDATTGDSPMEVTETNSSGGAPAAIRMHYGRVEFHTASSGTAAATFDSERMRILSNGAMAHGGTTQIENCLYNQHFAPATFSGIGMKPTAFVGYDAMRFNNSNGTRVGTINCQTNGTSYATTSDYRVKENVADMSGAIHRVKALSPKCFNFISDPDDTTVDGFLAHEAQAVVPEAVTGTHNEVDADGNPVMQGIDQSKLVPLLTGALQEAITKIEDLESRLAALEAN
jgi:hypothetical protein